MKTVFILLFGIALIISCSNNKIEVESTKSVQEAENNKDSLININELHILESLKHKYSTNDSFEYSFNYTYEFQESIHTNNKILVELSNTNHNDIKGYILYDVQKKQDMYEVILNRSFFEDIKIIGIKAYFKKFILHLTCGKKEMEQITSGKNLILIAQIDSVSISNSNEPEFNSMAANSYILQGGISNLILKDSLSNREYD